MSGLIPKIKIEYDKSTKKLQITDTTGFYDPTLNPTGYGAPNEERGDVIKATVKILYDKQSFFEKDVTSILSTSIDAEVDLGETGVIEEDGVYKGMILVNTTTEMLMSFPALEFLYENAEKKMSEYWVKLACIYDIYKKKKLETECIWLESNIQGLPALKNRGMESEFINLLRFIQKRFEVTQTLTI